MAPLKTQPTNEDVLIFLNKIDNEQRKQDCLRLLDIFKEVTSFPPRMWGDSIVGFGNYHYKYKSGQEGDWFLTGFSSRKLNITIYIMSGFKDFTDKLEKFGNYKTSSSCLYINKLDNINIQLLKELIKESVAKMKREYHET